MRRCLALIYLETPGWRRHAAFSFVINQLIKNGALRLSEKRWWMEKEGRESRTSPLRGEGRHRVRERENKEREIWRMCKWIKRRTFFWTCCSCSHQLHFYNQAVKVALQLRNDKRFKCSMILRYERKSIVVNIDWIKITVSWMAWKCYGADVCMLHQPYTLWGLINQSSFFLQDFLYPNGQPIKALLQ